MILGHTLVSDAISLGLLGKRFKLKIDLEHQPDISVELNWKVGVMERLGES